MGFLLPGGAAIVVDWRVCDFVVGKSLGKPGRGGFEGCERRKRTESHPIPEMSDPGHGLAGVTVEKPSRVPTGMHQVRHTKYIRTLQKLARDRPTLAASDQVVCRVKVFRGPGMVGWRAFGTRATTQ